MNKINDGASPAFPQPLGTETVAGCEGMTLRDYAAIKAMQGWLASYHPGDSHPVPAGCADLVAQHAYAMADAMVRARGAQ